LPQYVHDRLDETWCESPSRVDVKREARAHVLRARLVGLDGGAAGAELLRFAARVFELGAGVGVDELAGFDPLEAVTL
jgi:hypothetical protein